MNKLFDKALLEEMIQQDYVKVQKHPEADLFIYNYSQKAQYERVWNDVTLACRGLILNKDGELMARPFNKFFNLGEAEDQIIPDEVFEVYEKMDGSLGILYWHGDKPFIATRGSFASEQSAKANEILYAKYKDTFSLLDKNKTYLFEIIYPENRIVVDYGSTEDLVMLAVIDNVDGKDLPLENVGFPLVKRYDGIKDIKLLEELEEANKEGFVIKFANGVRYKVKFKEYIRIHRIVTMVSNVTLWEYLRDGKAMDEIIEKVPDEFFDWVKITSAQLHQSYKEIEDIAKAEYKELDSRKETALYFATCKYPAVMFNMLDKRDHALTIWKMLRPVFSKPFAKGEDA